MKIRLELTVYPYEGYGGPVYANGYDVFFDDEFVAHLTPFNDDGLPAEELNAKESLTKVLNLMGHQVEWDD